MSKDIIIYQPWGGLGDNLAFSTLPKLYSEAGYEVYISKKNVYRNPEIYDLVWKLNPYIKGESDLPPNAGSNRGFHIFCEDNCMKNMELTHGLSNGTTKYPEIYYKPTILHEFKDCLVYDITSISSNYSDEFINSTFTSIFNKYPELKRKLIRFKNISNRDTPNFSDDIIEVGSIFEYSNVIASCKVFITLLSGGSALASAIKKDNEYPNIYTFHHNLLNNKAQMYTFSNVTFGTS
jgi:hypothetical protein